MEEYNYTIIEKWWRSLGCLDRDWVSRIEYADYDGSVDLYLIDTDNWWDNLTREERLEKYNEFFEY